MKKLFLASLLFTSAVAFAYTQTDVQNATYLSGEGIITSQSTTAGYRLDDTITRAEAIGIALKIKGIALPNNYICKNYFTDASYNPINNWICRAVELARDKGIVSGENKKARPGDPITRSEVLAMIMYAALNNTLSIVPKGYTFSTDTVEWQKNIFYAAENLIMVAGTKYDYSRQPISVNYFPNRNATRAEVFGFAKNILTSKETSIEFINYTNSRHNFSLQYPKNWFIDERGDISNTNIVGSDLRGTIIVSDVKNGNDLDGTGISVKAFNIQVENVGTDRYYLSASGFTPITINNTKGVISKAISDDSTFYTVILYKNDLQFTISYTTKDQNDERIFDSILQSFTFL